MNTRSIINGLISLVLSAMVCSCNFGERTNENDPLSDDYVGVVENPVITPSGGVSTQSQIVTITCPTLNATIKYTVDGSGPNPDNEDGIEYNGPITIRTTTTVKAIAYLSGWLSSEIVSETFTITGVTADPVFSPEPGAYTAGQVVTISYSTPDSIIRYTTDGSTPSRAYGIIYDTEQPVNVNNTQTIKAIAYVNAWQPSSDSNVISGYYLISGTVANPTFSVSGGYYTNTQSVTIRCTTPGALVRYTTNGTDPTRSTGTQFDPDDPNDSGDSVSSPISVSSTTTVKAIAYIEGWDPSSDSAITTTTYTITGMVATPTFSVSQGYYYSSQSISILCTTPGAMVRYTTNGTVPSRSNGISFDPDDPNDSGDSVSSPITVNSTRTLRAIAYVPTWQTSSDTLSNPATYTINGTYKWTKRYGGTGHDMTVDCISDSAGNTYILGNFQGTVNFAADFGSTANITALSSSQYDVFLTKINSNGTYGGTRRIGGTIDNLACKLTVDNSGNVYIAGLFQGTVNFAAAWGGTDSKTSNGSYDIFVTKVNYNGSYGWTKRIGGTGFEQYALVFVSPDGSIIGVIGAYNGTVNFAQDFGGTDSQTASNNYDVFVTTFSSNLTYGYTHHQIGGGPTYIRDVIYKNGSIYICGVFSATVDFNIFDSQYPHSYTSNGGEDAFVIKLDPYYDWVKRFGSSGEDNANQICIDSSNNLYVVGSFQQTVSFDSFSKTSAGGRDIFVTQLSNGAGSVGWVRRIGADSDDSGYGIVVNSNGYLYITGSFTNSVNFGADFGTSQTKGSNGGLDIFVTRITNTASYGWTYCMGGSDGGELGFRIINYSNGTIGVCGLFGSSTINFREDFGGTENKANSGTTSTYDSFITVIE